MTTRTATDISLCQHLERVTTEPERRALLAGLAEAGGPTTVAFVNTHACNLAAKDPSFAGDLLATDRLLRDGSGMSLLCRRLGTDPGLNLNGTDFIPLILEQFSGRTVALFGTREPWLSTASAIVDRTLAVVARLDGFQPDTAYLEALREHPADLVVLAMGMPRQEHLAARLRRELDRPCVIVCGGAILDFMAGRVSRAPVWLRTIGMEWVWRLVSEPRRLFKRYVVGNTIFLARIATVRRPAGTPDPGGPGGPGRSGRTR